MVTIKAIIAAHHSVKIEYCNFDKQSNLELIHERLLKVSFLFPRWLDKLNITLYDEAPVETSTSEACVRSGNWEYGFADIDVYAKFFDRSERRQDEILVHELMHIAHGKLMDFDRKHLLKYVKGKNEELGAHLHESHAKLMEEFIDNMSRMIVENILVRNEGG